MEIERDVANKKDVKNPTLEEFGINLTIKAINGELDKVFGRDNELEDLIKILSRKKKNNAIMVSYPGVGKTSMVFLLAQRIVEQKVPTGLLNKVIYSLDSASLTAGTKYRGEMEDRVKKILKEAEEDENVMLFIDEIHTILDSSGNNAMNISNIMKPHLTSGKLQVVGATTFDEFSKFFEKDSALSRRFNRLTIEEPSIEACEVIIKQCIGSYEKFHNVNFSDEIIKQIPILAKKYIKDRYFPDSAIDIVDELGAKIKVERTKPSNKLLKMLDEMEENQKVKLELIKNEDWETISTFKPQVLDKLKNKITYEQEKFNERINNSDRIEITQEDLLKVVSKIGKVPLDKMNKDGKLIIKQLETILNKELISQEDAKIAILKTLKKKVLNIDKSNIPPSFLLAGPSGTGKTRLAEILSDVYFDGKMVKINGGEFSEAHNISRLLGAPAGFTGHSDTPHLLEKFIREPHALLLIDELEKMAKPILNVFLNILEKGECVDSMGRTISLSESIIIMTSNLGNIKSSYIRPGFNSIENKRVDLNDTTISEIKSFLTPEFYNRISTTVVYKRLTSDDFSQIFNIEYNKFKNTMKEQNITFNINKKVIDFLTDKYDDVYGARGIKRNFNDFIVDKTVDFLMENDNIKKINVTMNDTNDSIIIK